MALRSRSTWSSARRVPTVSATSAWALEARAASACDLSAACCSAFFSLSSWAMVSSRALYVDCVWHAAKSLRRSPSCMMPMCCRSASVRCCKDSRSMPSFSKIWATAPRSSTFSHVSSSSARRCFLAAASCCSRAALDLLSRISQNSCETSIAKASGARPSRRQPSAITSKSPSRTRGGSIASTVRHASYPEFARTSRHPSGRTSISTSVSDSAPPPVQMMAVCGSAVEALVPLCAQNRDNLTWPIARDRKRVSGHGTNLERRTRRKAGGWKDPSRRVGDDEAKSDETVSRLTDRRAGRYASMGTVALGVVAAALRKRLHRASK
mmetsp:Transcript_7054/g.21687  ORF Transcript_7054/g.21687 Transcript_7054/m.21687 type:complete len:324 (-) Transcript_7054:658-1629(-)